MIIGLFPVQVLQQSYAEPMGTMSEDITITLDFNGATYDGSRTQFSFKWKKSEKFTLPNDRLAQPPEGKVFKAWLVGSEEKNIGEEIFLTGNTTIKAIWQDDQIMREYQVYDVKFYFNYISGNIDIEDIDGMPEYTLFKVDEELFSDMIPYFRRGELAAIEINGVRKELGFGLVIKEDTTLKFIWNLVGERANVTFKMNNASNDEFQMNVKKNTKLTSEFLSFPSEGYLEGKEVDKIIINGVIINPNEITEIIITADTIIEFTWKNREKVKITFNPGNGGSGTMPEVEVDKGSMFIVPPNQFTPPPGKEFRHWLYSGVVKPVESVIFPERNIELKAVWKDAPAVPKVKISFHANGGFGPMEEKEVEKNSNYTLPPNEFLPPDGKEFKAWLVGTQEKAVGDEITVAENTEVKALWKDVVTVEKVKITFNGEGGSGTMPEQEVNKNTDYTLPANGFTAPTGKEFKAWLVGTEEKAVGD